MARGGRPAHYESPEEMQKKIDEYFKQGDLETPTQTGLALYLGFADRQSMYDYKNRDEFSCTIKKAFSRIDQVHEENLVNSSCSGSIFYLKNRGWTDKRQVQHEGDLTLFEALTEEHAQSHSQNGAQ